MILPTIHSGGTSQARLLADYYTAMVALSKFVDAWVNIDFHSRDYYVQGSPAWHLAVQERHKHTEALNKLADYLIEIVTHIETQKKLTIPNDEL